MARAIAPALMVGLFFLKVAVMAGKVFTSLDLSIALPAGVAVPANGEITVDVLDAISDKLPSDEDALSVKIDELLESGTNDPEAMGKVRRLTGAAYRTLEKVMSDMDPGLTQLGMQKATDKEGRVGWVKDANVTAWEESTAEQQCLLFALLKRSSVVTRSVEGDAWGPRPRG